MDRQSYIQKYYPLALAAGKKYGINPTVILAQGADESGWGTSYLAKSCHNFFGITASGSPNEYWNGERIPSSSNPNLVFRKYATDQDSFMDFARIISTYYKSAAAVSSDTAAYAHAIAYSPYISESNGDSRPLYQQNLTSNATYIDGILAELKKKQ